MKQHVLPNQFKEVFFDQVLLIIGRQPDRGNCTGLLWKCYCNAHYHNKKVTIGKMIEFIGEDTTRQILTARKREYEEYYLNLEGDLVDTLWEACKYKLNEETISY